MEPALKPVIELVHKSPTRAVLYITGGASQVLGWILSVPGASNTLLEATVPYSRRAVVDILKKSPTQFSSATSAREMAIAALFRAVQLSQPGVSAFRPVVGIGCTCALVSVPPRKGEHRCFVSARTQSHTWDYSITFTKGLRDREGEDKIASQLVLQALAAAACDDAHRHPGINSEAAAAVAAAVRRGLSEEEAAAHSVTMEERRLSETEQLELLLRGESPLVSFPDPARGHGHSIVAESDGNASAAAAAAAAASCAGGARLVVLSGSFNPLHPGHLGVMEAACETVGGPTFACFEIAAINADKGSLEPVEILRRVQSFKERGLLVAVTREPFFSGKAKIFRDATFVIGIDTVVRLINPKYYGGSEQAMEEALLEMGRSSCDFAVAGRLLNGVFTVLSDIALPSKLSHMFREIKGFRMDFSSTEIRQQQKAANP